MTLRTILLLLYAAGLHLGEAVALNHTDVDLTAAVLTVRRTKFYKSRLVPVWYHSGHTWAKPSALRRALCAPAD